MNFKSNAAYKNYLGYIYANNLNKPGGAPVTIKGKHHEVDRGDQYGGYLMGEGGGISSVGYPFNNPTFKAFGFANGGSFNNPGFQALPKEVQAKIRANAFAEGGQMDPLTEFNEGGRHEENPLGGIPQGMAPDGQPNLVEQGETKLNAADYIFSDRLKLDKQTVEEFNLPKTLIGKTFADASKKADRPDSRRENDSIEMKAKEKELNTLMEAQEAFKAKEVAKKMEEIASLDPTALQGMGQPQIPQSVEPMGMPQGMPVDPNQIPPEMLAQMPAAQQGAPIMAMGGHVYMCGGHRYDFGSFLKDTGDFLGNYGKGLADASLSTLGMKDVISDDMYKGKSANLARKTAGIVGGINAAIAPAAMNMVLPGSGMLVSGLQQGLGQATAQPQEVPQDPMAAQKTPEQIAEEQRQQQLNNLSTQYGNVGPTGFNAQVMAGGGHMYYGDPRYSSFLNNFSLNSDYNFARNNYTPYYKNPFTGFTTPKPNSFIPMTDQGPLFMMPGNKTGQAPFAPLEGPINTLTGETISEYAPGSDINNIVPSQLNLEANTLDENLPTNSNSEITSEEDLLSGFNAYKPNYTSQAEDMMGNPFQSNYKNPLTGESYLGFNGNDYNNTGLTNTNKSVTSTVTPETTGTVYPETIDNKLNIKGSPLSTIGGLGALGYNAYMALKKPKTYAAADFYTAPQLKELEKLNYTPVSLERLNYRPALEATEKVAAGAFKNLRDTGDAGTFLNNLATIQNVYGDTAKATALQGENVNTELANKERLYNQQGKQETAKYNTQLDQYKNQLLLSIAEREAAARELAQKANWQTQAARQEFFKAIPEQLKNMGDTSTQNQLGVLYANTMAPKGYEFSYTPWLQSLLQNVGNV